MQVVDVEKSEHGPQRRKSNGGRLLHCCCICGALEEWGDSWSYYGSLQELDNAEPVAKFCSPLCKETGGIKCSLVTEEMKATAKASEWRDPTIAYRPATEQEKYRAAVLAHRKR